MFVTLVRVLRLIKTAWVVVMIGLVRVVPTDRMIAMSQTMSGSVSRRKCHGYGWRHEGEHSEGGHSKSYAKVDAPSQCCQHAAGARNSCTGGILLGARQRATACGTHVLYQWSWGPFPERHVAELTRLKRTFDLTLRGSIVNECRCERCGLHGLNMYTKSDELTVSKPSDVSRR